MSSRITFVMWAVLALILYGVSFGITYGVVSYAKGSAVEVKQQTTASSNNNEDTSGPKDTPSILNGAMYTKTQSEKWKDRRPLAVMIENHTEARPQSGLSKADIVYEAVAEGGITRFMAIFHAQDADIIGPVRSARTYFLDWASEYDPLYAHVGGANTPGPANALGQIRDYGIRDMDQFGLGFPTYKRDYERLPGVATEHTMYSSTEALWKKGAERGWSAVDSKTNKQWDATYESWKFKDDAAKEARPASASAAFDFWSSQPAFNVKWEYDKENNVYKRIQAGSPHLDKNNGQQLTTKNLVIQFMTESYANDGYPGNVHLLYGTKGKGKAYILEDGRVTTGEWRKATRTARTRYYNEKGEEVKFNRGTIWITTLPTGNTVTF